MLFANHLNEFFDFGHALLKVYIDFLSFHSNGTLLLGLLGNIESPLFTWARREGDLAFLWVYVTSSPGPWSLGFVPWLAPKLLIVIDSLGKRKSCRLNCLRLRLLHCCSCIWIDERNKRASSILMLFVCTWRPCHDLVLCLKNHLLRSYSFVFLLLAWFYYDLQWTKFLSKIVFIFHKAANKLLESSIVLFDSFELFDHYFLVLLDLHHHVSFLNFFIHVDLKLFDQSCLRAPGAWVILEFFLLFLLSLIYKCKKFGIFNSYLVHQILLKGVEVL